MIDVTYVDHMGTDLSVVNAARVSFGKSSTFDGRVGGPNVLKQADAKLINYLAKHKHMSPFGHAFVTFHVKAPIFVARQLVKHKFLRWNEISRRYVDAVPEFYEPDEWRGRADDKKQGSAGVVDIQKSFFIVDPITDEEPQDTDRIPETLNEFIITAYRDLIIHGVCPEQARMVLPQSTMTEWYWSGSLDAFADMCILRCKEDTQLETARAAQCISQAMQNLFPISWEALTE